MNLEQWILRTEDRYYDRPALSWRNRSTNSMLVWGFEQVESKSNSFILWTNWLTRQHPADPQLCQQLYERDQTTITHLALLGHSAAQQLITHMETVRV